MRLIIALLALSAAGCGVTREEQETATLRQSRQELQWSESDCRSACEKTGWWGLYSGPGCTCVCATRCEVCGSLGCNTSLGY